MDVAVATQAQDAPPPPAAAAAAAVPDVGGLSGNGAQLDETRQQHMAVQQHAAAVQLLHRSLAVAHLRAEASKPRGGALAVPMPQPPAAVKHEPGTEQQPQEQQQARWQAPQQPPPQPPASEGGRQGIVIRVSGTADGAAAGALVRRTRPKQRQLVHRPPDAQAAARFAAELPQPLAAPNSEGVAAVPDAVAIGTGAAAPRLVVTDSALLAQQLSGWVRLGPDGQPLPGEGDGRDVPDAAGGAGAGVLPAAAAAASGEGQAALEQAGGAADLMDEEEWV